MTIRPTISKAQVVDYHARQFAQLALGIMRHKNLAALQNAVELPKAYKGGMGSDLVEIIKSCGREISRAEIQKSPVGNQSLGTDTPFANYSAIQNGFLNSLSNAGAFDAIVPSCMQLPLRLATVGAISSAATAYSVTEGQMKQLSRLSFTSQNSDPLKAMAMVVLSQELVRFAAPGAIPLIQENLRRAVALTTDTIFLAALTAGVSVGTSVGNTAVSIVEDIRELLQAVTTGSDSRLFLITTSAIVKNWVGTAGDKTLAFPDLTPQGGSIAGIPVIVSDAVTAGQVILVDASSIGANAGELTLSEAHEGSLQFESSPDSPAGSSTAFINLFQMNLSAVRVERYFVAEKIRSSSVAAISNSLNYSTGNSPP